MSTESHSTGLLSLSFSNSLQDRAIECLGDILEIKLDSMLEDGILKDIPFISTAISIYRIGHTIHDRHYLKKLAIFIDQINRGIENETVRQEYIERFQKNQKSCNQELEYILILVDRYVGYDKPQMLAKLFRSFLNKDITWTEFSVYAEVIDRFLPGDAELLCTDLPLRINREKEQADSSARLVSLGLMSEYMEWGHFSGGTLNLSNKPDKRYKMTKFGNKLVSILKQPVVKDSKQ